MKSDDITGKARNLLSDAVQGYAEAKNAYENSQNLDRPNYTEELTVDKAGKNLSKDERLDLADTVLRFFGDVARTVNDEEIQDTMDTLNEYGGDASVALGAALATDHYKTAAAFTDYSEEELREEFEPRMERCRELIEGEYLGDLDNLLDTATDLDNSGAVAKIDEVYDRDADFIEAAETLEELKDDLVEEYAASPVNEDQEPVQIGPIVQRMDEEEDLS